MVQQAFSYVEKISNLDIKLKLIDTLRTVTAGKVSMHTVSLHVSVVLFHNRPRSHNAFLNFGSLVVSIE